MFKFYGLKDGVKAERFLITIPGTKTTAKAVLFEGVPYFHVGKVLAAVAKPTTSVFSNVYVALKRLIDNSSSSIGALLVTKGGLFADTTALRCIVPTFFLDVKHTCEYSYVRSMISKVGSRKGHLPDIRTVRNHELYAQLLNLPNAEPVMANAAKQIPAEAVEEIAGYTTEQGRVKFIPIDDIKHHDYSEPHSDDMEKNAQEPSPSSDIVNPSTFIVARETVPKADRKNPEEAETPIVQTALESKIKELSVADFLQLAKQLLTTREVSITFSVK